jgi:transporter family protein
MNSFFSKNNISVIVLSFIGMFCWGITPIFVKIGLKETAPQLGLAIRTATTTIILTGCMIGDGSFDKISKITVTTLVFLVAEAIVATFIGDLAYFAAVKNGQVSLVSIIFACAPLVTIIFSVIFLKETVNATRLIGSFMVIGGIILALK